MDAGKIGVLAVLALGLCAGCRYAGPRACKSRCGGSESFALGDARGEYVTYLREVMDDAKRDPDFFIGHTLTDSEDQCKREMVYLDAKYLSYRIEEYWYHGGAHGSTKISVGTLERETGRQLTLNDVFGNDGLSTLEEELRKAVAKKIGEENIQARVKLTENFYLAEDGWHFVYNEYEVACYACGAVEVVIPRSKDARGS